MHVATTKNAALPVLKCTVISQTHSVYTTTYFAHVLILTNHLSAV